jgi:hypothetical protein
VCCLVFSWVLSGEVASSAAETAKQSTQEHGQDLAQGAKQNVQDLDAQTGRRTRS